MRSPVVKDHFFCPKGDLLIQVLSKKIWILNKTNLFIVLGDLYNEAAEAAMAAMKGRLANKYFALAEECYGEVEEKEESEQ